MLTRWPLAPKLLRRWLIRLGLRTEQQRAWAAYDWANSAFQCTIVTAVFPVYFASVAADNLPPAVATERFAMATTLALAIVAVIAPVLGAYADFAGAKKRLLAIFLGVGVISTAAMVQIGSGDWLLAAVLFVVANIGVSGSFVFYDSLLPHVADDSEMDRVSSAGYALGYLGGGVLLAINLSWILNPGWFGLADAGVASRLSFLSVAIWWLAFAIPLFRTVPEPDVRHNARSARVSPIIASFRQLAGTLRELRQYRQAFLMLVAFLIYNDGIGTIIRMAGPYGQEIGLPQNALIAAFVMVQFVGIPFAFAFGRLADRIGAKPSIFIALVVYVLISLVGYFMTTIWQFFLLSFMVATVQGGSQALSRSLFATMIPKHKSSEFFGFFGVFEKFAGIIGPLLFAATVRMTGSSRNAILSVIAFFVVGALLLWMVDVEEGQRAARA
jgi:MFS transporter, UMF1 family